MRTLRNKIFQLSRLKCEAEHFDELKSQLYHDFIKRQLLGILFYPLSWLFISIAILYQTSSFSYFPPLLFWFFILSVIAIWRYYSLRFYKKRLLVDKEIELNKAVLNVFISAASWGLMLAFSAFEGVFSEKQLIIIFSCSFALCTIGVISLAMYRRMVLVFLLGMLFPVILVVFLGKSVLGPEFAFLTLFYSFSMYFMSIFPRREYELLVNANFKLSVKTKQLSLLTMQDSLTGIHNRRYFNKTFDVELSRASRIDYSLVLLMIDIDHFKAVNDKYGHLAGDHCLVQIAEVINSNKHRKTDIFARYGGEEFVLVLTNISKENGAAYAEQLRKAVEETNFYMTYHKVDLTISIGGVYVIPGAGVSANRIIDAADKALYQSKTQGRNQVTWGDLIGEGKRISHI